MRRRGRSDRTAGTRAWVDALVRSGLGSAEDVHSQVLDAVRTDHPDLDGDAVASRWISEALSAWRSEAEGWSGDTDYDRLQEAFEALAERGVVVLQGCQDHWAARDVADLHHPVGIAWFTPPDVWHAVDEGMLEINLWHGTSANVAPGDQLLEDVLGVFATVGLSAHFDEGRIEVAAHWRRRP